MNKTKTSKASSSEGRYMNSFVARKMGSASKKSGSSHAKSHGAKAPTNQESRDSMDVELLNLTRSKRTGESTIHSETGGLRCCTGPSDTQERVNVV